MYGYIYKTTNLINGKIYVGEHKSSYFNEFYKGSGKLLWNAIRKYGLNNFKTELLEECDSKAILDEREKYWIATLDARNHDVGYNIHQGGQGGTVKGTHKVISEAQKLKLRLANLGRKNPHTKEWNEKISKAQKGVKRGPSPQRGRKRTEEQKQRIREATRAAMQRKEVHDKLVANTKKAMWRDDVRQKYLTNFLKVAHTEEYRRKASEAQKRRATREREAKLNDSRKESTE